MKTRRPRWTRNRGTAMVELAIVSPIIVLVWASIDYFRNDFLLAQQKMHESRTVAWSYATAGKCGSGLGAAIVGAGERAALFGDFGAEAVAAFELMPGHGTILATGAELDYTTPPETSRAGRGGFTFLKEKQVVGRTFLHCNDELPTIKNTAPALLLVGAKELSVQ